MAPRPLGYRYLQLKFISKRLLKHLWRRCAVDAAAAAAGYTKRSISLGFKRKRDDDDDDDDRIKRKKSSSSSSSWSDGLPRELLEQILKRMCLDDFLRFGMVCSSWRSAVADAVASSSCSPAPQPFPLLVSASHPYRSDYNFNFVNLNFESSSRRSYYVPDRRALDGKVILGSVGGWLIVAEGFSLRPEGIFDHESNSSSNRWWVKNYTLNPISGSRVLIPSQNTIPCRKGHHNYNYEHFFLNKVVASSSAPPTSPNWVVAAATIHRQLVFCRPSTDKKWTLIDDADYAALACHVNDQYSTHIVLGADGKQLYAITATARDVVMVYDLLFGDGDGNHSYRANKLVMLDPKPPASVGGWNVDGLTWSYSNYPNFFHLVTDPYSNQLFLVIRIADFAFSWLWFWHWSDNFDANYLIPPTTKRFLVFKLDRQSDQSTARWIPVEDLGNMAMFVGGRNCNLVSLPPSPPTSTIIQPPGGENSDEDQQLLVRANCMYFAFDHHKSAGIPYSSIERDVGVFSLADGTINRLLPQEDASKRSWVFPPVWFTPSLK